MLPNSPVLDTDFMLEPSNTARFLWRPSLTNMASNPAIFRAAIECGVSIEGQFVSPRKFSLASILGASLARGFQDRTAWAST